MSRAELVNEYIRLSQKEDFFDKLKEARKAVAENDPEMRKLYEENYSCNTGH